MLKIAGHLYLTHSMYQLFVFSLDFSIFLKYYFTLFKHIINFLNYAHCILTYLFLILETSE